MAALIGYDPKTDPIVRTQARRLRLKLEEYYQGPGRQDRVVITVPTGGYAPQFDIRPETVPQLAVVATSEPISSRPMSPSRFRLAWLGVALLAGTFGGVLWHGFVNRHPPAVPPHAVPVTHYQGFEFQPSLSPDGQRVAFVWNGTDNHYNLYVKSVDADEPMRLTSGPEYDIHPSWSPDGRQIAFLRLSPDGARQIGTMAATGGPAHLLYPMYPARIAWVQEASLLRRLPGPAWSPDGQFLVVSDHLSSQEPDRVYLLSVQTGAKKQLTFPRASDVGDYYPAFSPDGQSLTFVRIFNQRNSSDLYVQSLQGGTARRITFASKEITGLTWATDDRLVFASDRLGSFQLWSVPSRGGSPVLVPGAGQDVSQPTASANGLTLVYAERFRNTGIWRVPLGTGPPATPAKLIASSTENDSGQYSPDGQRIVFVSDRSGVPALWTCRADGSNPVLLLTGNGASVGTPRWSPDGRQIVFDTVREGRAVIELIQAEGGTPHLLTSGEFDYMMPSWSRDGRWIYYASSVGSKTTQLWKQPVAGGAPVQVTHEGGGEAHESLDGKTLYYLKPQLGIWQMPVGGGAETLVPGLEHVYASRHLAVSRTGLYLLASEDPPWTVYFYQFATRRISTVATIQRTPSFETPSLSVSPDGHWLLYSQLDQAGEDVMALHNIQY